MATHAAVSPYRAGRYKFQCAHTIGDINRSLAHLTTGQCDVTHIDAIRSDTTHQHQSRWDGCLSSDGLWYQLYVDGTDVVIHYHQILRVGDG